jgi:hypothetical protein
MVEKQETTARKAHKLSLSKRGNRIPIPSNSFSNSDGMIPSLAHAGSNLQQEYSFGDSSDDQDHDRNKSRSGDVKGEASVGLRVNHNQHMTDADFSGGLMLHSNSTNPRGLKLMFGH